MNHRTPIDPAARAEREARDRRIYEFIRNGQRAEAMLAEHAAYTGPTIGAPIGTARARELAARSAGVPRRPAITSARVRQLAALADLVRPRAKSTSTLYGLPREAAADIRRAIAYIDDLAAWERAHR